MANDAPIAIDFLSDPSGGITGTKQMELELTRITKRVEILTKAFQTLDASISSGMVTRIASIANSTNRMQAGAQASAAAAQALATSLAAVSNASGPLALITTELTALVAQLRSAGQAARSVRPGSAGAGAGGGGSSSSGAGGNTLIGGVSSALAYVALGAGIKSATSAALDLEQALAGVAAVGEIDRATGEFRKLSAAVEEGSRQFTSLEKAAGLRELVASGLSATQATQGLTTVLQLATAGEIGMGRAAEILVASMSAFKIEAKDAVKVADALTAAANASPASIEDMGEAMKFIAPVASALKIPLNETSAALALLANNGIRGGMAGRGLGAVFARIVAPSKDATEALKRFGLTANDINPGLVGMETAMRRLGSLDQETLVRMFGAENLDVSNVLASNNVAISGLIDKMNGASGAVNRFADAVASTAAGKLTALKNTVSEVKTEIGKMSVEILTAAGNLVKGTWADPNNILKGLRTLNQNMNPAGDVSAGEAANFESRIRKATGNIEPLLSEIRTRQMEIGDALNVEVDSFFPNDDAIKNLRKVWDELERVRNKAKEINDQGKAAAALQAVSTVASKIGGRFSAAMANIEERKNNSIIGPIQGKYLPGDPFEMADKTRALQEALDKSAEIQDDMVRKRKEFNDSLAIEEAKAAGKNTLAEKLQRELDLMREKSRLAKELGLSPEDAGNLAERLVTAQGKVKGRDTANTVADSLQSIGGGGRFFSGGDQSARIMSDQLAEQKKIREGIALLNERLGNGNGVIKAAFN